MKGNFWEYIKIATGCQRREEIMVEAELMEEEADLPNALIAKDVWGKYGD